MPVVQLAKLRRGRPTVPQAKGHHMITFNDRCELRLFEMYLKRRAERPTEDPNVAYAEVYGVVVFDVNEPKPKMPKMVRA